MKDSMKAFAALPFCGKFSRFTDEIYGKLFVRRVKRGMLEGGVAFHRKMKR